MVKSIIGIPAMWESATWRSWTQVTSIIPDLYSEKVVSAGGIPIGLVPVGASVSDIDQLVERIDGLLLMGGADVDPSFYGQQPSDMLGVTSPGRDEFELTLVHAALERDVPVLGICRGLQIMNVATGGTLFQHLNDVGYSEHLPYPGSIDEGTYHAVTIESHSLAAEGMGEGLQYVNSHHHQGIDRIGQGARVVASAGDGLPEALEWREHRYALGVQWHPEAMSAENTIAAFVAATATKLRESHDPGRRLH